jgi:probable rRNA maturation factor
MSELVLRNRQRVRPVDLRQLRRATRVLLHTLLQLPEHQLGVHLVAAPEMAALNETFLHHPGSTDVITFDHADAASGPAVHGELFICLDDAVAQARQFGTSWQAELMRYLIHGLLHLRGYDDRDVRARQRMKRRENRLVSELGRRFDLNRLTGRPRLRT